MSGAIPPLPNTPSWPGDQLKKAKEHMNLLDPLSHIHQGV